MELIDGRFVNGLIGQLPIAEAYKVVLTNGNNQVEPKDKVGIVVNGKCVGVVSDHYNLVQHEQAFRPIIDGLTVSGVQDFKANAVANHKWAKLRCFINHVADDKQGIKYGFQAENSFDGKSAIKFGAQMSKYFQEEVQVKHQVVKVWGFRLACQNGMIVRVPLDYETIVSKEIREKLKEILSQRLSIRHDRNAEANLKTMQYVVEAYLLLRNPMEKMIKLAQKIKIGDIEAFESLMKKYVGKRKAEAIAERYNTDAGDNLWHLYNAMTFIATHERMKESTRNSLYEKAAVMLEREVVAHLRH